MNDRAVALAQYCERAGDGFWAEPVNAFTNLAFLLAAGLLVHRLRQLNVSPWSIVDLWLLVMLVAMVGGGSFLWHTFDTHWSMLADVIPVLMFISVFILSFLARIARLTTIADYLITQDPTREAFIRAIEPESLSRSPAMTQRKAGSRTAVSSFM
jgi:hypothetical protein